VTDETAAPASVRARASAQIARLVRAIQDGDDSMVEESVLRLSRSHRLLAPLALVVSAFVMLFDGVKLLFANWRLTVVQVLPAMWIWLAMVDLKAHVLHGRSFNILRGPVLIPVVLLIAAITAASFYLNAVFAFAIATPGRPEVRPAMTEAWKHRRVILAWGGGVGLLLAFATVVVDRWGLGWFALTLSIVVGLMMVCYVAVPARLVGVEKSQLSRRDKLASAAIGGAIGAVVCTPPYLLARVGLLMLGSQLLLIPGIVLLAVGLTLQAGATGSVKAVKMSTKLIARPGPTDGDETSVRSPDA
jgi:hypothetical protein